MRVDKWLKVVRLIKRRSVAHDAAALGRVTVNGRDAKPATEVKPGDRVSLRLGSRQLTVEVVATPAFLRGGEDAPYRILEERRVDDGTG